jgi:hypothetical protein
MRSNSKGKLQLWPDARAVTGEGPTDWLGGGAGGTRITRIGAWDTLFAAGRRER